MITIANLQQALHIEKVINNLEHYGYHNIERDTDIAKVSQSILREVSNKSSINISDFLCITTKDYLCSLYENLQSCDVISPLYFNNQSAGIVLRIGHTTMYTIHMKWSMWTNFDATADIPYTLVDYYFNNMHIGNVKYSYNKDEINEIISPAMPIKFAYMAKYICATISAHVHTIAPNVADSIQRRILRCGVI